MHNLKMNNSFIPVFLVLAGGYVDNPLSSRYVFKAFF